MNWTRTPTLTSKPALLIDLDGVLRLWPPVDAEVEAAFGLPSGLIHRIAFEPQRLRNAITGRISDAQWRSQITERLALLHPDVDAHAAVQRWSAPVGSVNHSVLETLRAVRPQMTVLLFTNATSRLPQDLKALGLLHDFDLVINSSRAGVAKPEACLFQAALQAADVRAEQAWFVDDTARHVKAAQALGLNAHHYRSGPAGDQALREFLQRAIGRHQPKA